MDFLDIAMGKFNQTYTGKFYKALPSPVLPQSDEDLYEIVDPEIFNYEYVQVTSKTYKKLIDNLTEAEGITTVIKTRNHLKWKIGSYVILMDGRMCTVTSVIEDRSNTNSEAARLFPFPLETEFILQLVECENPRGIS